MLAAEEDRRRQLVPLLPDPEDSGIDSDAPERPNLDERRVPRSLRFLELSEASGSSDEESGEKSWWRRPQRKNNQQNNVMDNQPQPINQMRWQSKCPRTHSDDETNPDRASPPLYEVELTASDEDDDASVLELVIPMQSRRTRVPASSPKKIIANCLICTFLCCVRK
ncbi:uncharacterized protein LOC115443228 [Manduca sexta]|uniref:Uncharacterized protein n=1 Tax=Manduca sexta TaxID=7130 RepID=A0A921Z2E2_MANSE|nr:uncharacterized protein LOC115443228 [Manduca sexta]XP_030024408.1 uncharacterized protein LOC115443228 [Manduca sexta]KAG6449711.1 hypothetical protein O3G_MSEX006180 [Manduca sexta]